MKYIILSLAVFTTVLADVSHLEPPRGPDADAPILRQESDVGPEEFSYAYETGNGISGQESGKLKNVGAENPALEVQGSNQYTAPDGQVIQITYIANENGYQPSGSHLPTPPPAPEIPDYILKSLEYIRTHPPKE